MLEKFNDYESFYIVLAVLLSVLICAISVQLLLYRYLHNYNARKEASALGWRVSDRSLDPNDWLLSFDLQLVRSSVKYASARSDEEQANALDEIKGIIDIILEREQRE